MARPGDKSGQRGYALVLTLFLLASASTAGYLIVEHGLTARKSARAASLSITAVQRAATATWTLADDLLNPNSLASRIVTVDGRVVAVAATYESGRIDLNALPIKVLGDAITSLGIEPRQGAQAAELIVDWRGTEGRTALWSLDDLDAISGLEPEIRECLRLWGSVHARSPFMGSVPSREISNGLGDDDLARLVLGSIIRIVAFDQTTQRRFRSVLLYRGVRPGPNAATLPRSVWLPLEWLRPAEPDSCQPIR